MKEGTLGMINDRPLSPRTSTPNISAPLQTSGGDTVKENEGVITQTPSQMSPSTSPPKEKAPVSLITESQLQQLQGKLDQVSSESLLGSSQELPPPTKLSSSRELVVHSSSMGPMSPTRLRALALIKEGNVLPKGTQTLPSGTWKQALSSLVTDLGTRIKHTFKPVTKGPQDTASTKKLETFIQGIDPFGLLQAPPATTDSAKSKYKNIVANQSQAFLKAVSITGPTQKGEAGIRPAPDEGALDSAIGTPMETVSGIPKVQHSIWVGGPLKASETKHKAFMDQLVKNAENNPGWDVCLWTDQSRAAMQSASPDSDLGKMRDWAIANKINLVPVDEVFAGDNAMELQGLYKAEQLKGGTGRAAASDIMRLEIINRFGGIYCDGDKPFKKPMDEIAQYTADHGNFTTAQEKGNFQNCGMCGSPGNDLTRKVLEKISDNYGKPRDSLLSQEHMSRPTRFEVILRTGPTIVQNVALSTENLSKGQSNKSKHLMPIDFITPPSVYTTSWDPSKIPCHGDRDLAEEARLNKSVESSQSIQTRVSQEVAELRKTMQTKPVSVTLSPEQETALKAAVEKGVTTLAYGIWNNNGLLNMELAEQHIKSSPNPDLAREMILEVFKSDKMQDLAALVTSVQLPGTAPTKDHPPKATPIPESTLDMLFRSDVFPNLKFQDLTLQHAAYMGNTQLIEYADRHGMLDLSVQSAHRLETGERRKETNSFGTSLLTTFEAAVRGGQRDVLAMLTARPEFGTWLKDEIGKYNDFQAMSPKDQAKVDPAPRHPLNEAAQAGQIDTVLWSIKALPSEEQAKLNLPQLLDKLMSAKPSPKSELQDADKCYVFKQFAAGYATEMAKALPLSTPEFSLMLKNSIESGNYQLAAEMEKQGSSLQNLSIKDQGALKTLVGGTRIDMVKYTNPILRLAHKAGLISDMMTGQANRRTPTLQTDKNEHATPPNLNNTLETVEYLAKGMAYANDHIARNHKGRASRVSAWRTNVTQIVNQLGAIASSQRTPEQQALLDAATLVNKRLYAMKSK